LEEKDKNTMSKNKVFHLNRIVALMVAITIGFTVMPGFVPRVYSSDGAAFLGGMVAGHVFGGTRMTTAGIGASNCR
jgi:pimeloyl-CoA synthetase